MAPIEKRGKAPAARAEPKAADAATAATVGVGWGWECWWLWFDNDDVNADGRESISLIRWDVAEAPGDEDNDELGDATDEAE